MKNNVKSKILVLGGSGMLGLMVKSYLSKNNFFDVVATERNENSECFFDAQDFLCNFNKYLFLKDFDYIINCIGIIKPHCKDDDPVGVLNAIKVNALFPHVLSKYLLESNTKIIQIATDCVYTGKIGKYIETSEHDAIDVYGKTKSLGEVKANNFLNIRCSIIGPEKKNKLSLLEWFLNQKDGSTLNGFKNHFWNGITTLQFAQLCELIIEKNIFYDLNKNNLIHFLPNTTVSKYELLNIFNEAFNKNFLINESQANVAVDRTISTINPILTKHFPSQTMKSAIKDLANYLNNNPNL